VTATPTEREAEGPWVKLRRRKVVQWGIAYAAGAWGLLQVLAYVAATFHWPEQIQRLTTLALLIGLPVVIALAWLHGDLAVGRGLLGRVERAVQTDDQTGVVSSFVTRPTADPDTRPGIAVIPFQNRSRLDEDIYFVDGVHDDILIQLSKVGAMKVIARTSVEQFRNTTLTAREIGARLGVTRILAGGVQRAGDRVRIQVQLIDANTDVHIWAESYDRNLSATNIFAIQSEVATAIADALETTITPAERRRIGDVPTRSLEAWEAYQLGKQRMARRTSADLADAERFFRRAIDRDPEFALAYAGLADTALLQVTYSGRPYAAMHAKAAELVSRALDLSPDLPEAVTTSAQLASDESAFERAIALNPNYSAAHHRYSILLLDSGRRNEALRQAELALELDPISTIYISHSANVLVAVGHFEEALAQYRKIIEIDPTMPFAYWGVADVYQLGLGRLDLAIPWAEKAATLDPRNPANTIYLAALYEFIGDEDRAARWSELALKHGEGLVWVHEVMAMSNLYKGNHVEFLAHARSAAAVDARHIRHLVAADVRAGAYDAARERHASAYPALFNTDLESVTGVLSITSELPTIDGTLPFAAIDLAVVLQHTGESEHASALLDRSEAVIRTMPRMGRFGYGVADVAIHALRGETVQALAGLREAERCGWVGGASEAGDWHWRYERDFDPALASIRHEPEFKAVFARIEARIAVQRARLAARPEGAPLDLALNP
jgi:TolB-like protein/predicted Zn-dependent protease